MGERCSKRKSAAAKKPKPSHSVRMDGDVFMLWGVWTQSRGMSYEESIIFLLDKHPIDTKALTELRRKIIKRVRGESE